MKKEVDKQKVCPKCGLVLEKDQLICPCCFYRFGKGKELKVAKA